MNKMFNKILVLIILLCPMIVFATNQNSSVYFGNNLNECTKYQDSTLSTSKDAYFSHCMEATCKNGKYSLTYFNNNTVKCSNGNNNPYYKVVNSSACNNYNSCSDTGEVKYCSMIIYYDCSRTINGSSFGKTTTTTKKTTTKKRTTTKKTTTTTTSTTTQAVASNTKLKSLALSNASIIFNSEVYEYTINIESTVDSVNVTAVPEDINSKVEVIDNTNLVDGSVIKVIVTGTDGSTSEYKINVKKEAKIMSSNAKLKSLTVEDYTLSFKNTIYEYSLIIDRDVSELNINYEPEDENAIVSINGNENLENGSKITINVTAEDGTENNYIINISVKKKSNFIKILFIIILLLAILAGAYYIYKKFVLSKTGEKYEYE